MDNKNTLISFSIKLKVLKEIVSNQFPQKLELLDIILREYAFEDKELDQNFVDSILESKEMRSLLKNGNHLHSEVKDYIIELSQFLNLKENDFKLKSILHSQKTTKEELLESY